MFYAINYLFAAGPPPQNGVTVTPAAVTVPTGGTTSFSAIVAGTSNQAVTWTVQEASGGTITPVGGYTAPATPGTYHVVATSQADPSKNGTAVVTVVPPAVSVSIDPSAVSVAVGGTTTLTATVSNSGNTAVSWNVQEPAGGTITSAGVYTASQATGTYHVIATSQADPSKTATATVSVVQQLVTVTVTPSSMSLVPNSGGSFTATVGGTSNTGVVWSVQEGTSGGTVSDRLVAAPSIADYHAPSMSGGTFHVIATSQADPTKSGSATVTIVPSITVTVLPATATIPTKTQISLTAATLTNNTYLPDGVTWSATGGTISGSGLAVTYTAPATPGTYTVTATTVADAGSKFTVTINAIFVPVAVAILPASTSVAAGGNYAPFRALVSGSTDDQHVTWQVQEGSTGGTITNTGIYKAPSAPGTYHLVATAVEDTSASASATVTVAPPNPLVIIGPSSISTTPGSVIDFIAAISEGDDQRVTWSVQESGAGSITSSGRFTVPSQLGTYHVLASSVADPSRNGVAAVTVKAGGLAASVPFANTEMPAGPYSCAPYPHSGERRIMILAPGQPIVLFAPDRTDIQGTIIEGSVGGTLSSAVRCRAGGYSSTFFTYTAPVTKGIYHLSFNPTTDPSAVYTVVAWVRTDRVFQNVNIDGHLGRMHHTLTKLPNGKVLIVGGSNYYGWLV